MPTDQGIVYVATKQDRYVEEAFLSADSVKQWVPDMPITLFTDLPKHALCRTDRFDAVEAIQGVKGFASGWAEGRAVQRWRMISTESARPQLRHEVKRLERNGIPESTNV